MLAFHGGDFILKQNGERDGKHFAHENETRNVIGGDQGGVGGGLAGQDPLPGFWVSHGLCRGLVLSHQH